LIAARVAEQLSKDSDVEVEIIKGSFLELSVSIDGQKVIETNPLWYPLPGTLINRTHELLIAGRP
jgi:hypothetical protein